jgi:hypothetical protein
LSQIYEYQDELDRFPEYVLKMSKKRKIAEALGPKSVTEESALNYQEVTNKPKRKKEK